MRHRIVNYTIQGQDIVLEENVTIEDIRLIVNETRNVVITSSMQKANITVNDNIITVPASVCTLGTNNKLTIEIDKGDGLEEVNDKLDSISTDITAISGDALQGKRKLAAAITNKGVRTNYTESLSDMAINVSAIPQTIYTGDSNFDAMVMPSEYMWNVYKIAEDFIGNNPYPYANRFFVAEYYRGYDSLVLSGADAYLTCDGDYYEVMGEQCIHTRLDGTQEVLEGKDPNHIWHDEDNGKMNRYVIFFFQADTYTFSNTTSAICPRRVAISGNCASFIVSGENRLTDVWVLGMLGHFEGGSTGTSWSPAQVIRNYREHSGGIFYNKFKGLSIVMPELRQCYGGTLLKSCDVMSISMPNLEVVYDGLITGDDVSYSTFMEKLIELNLPSLVEYNNAPLINLPYRYSYSLTALRKISLPKLKTINHPIVSYNDYEHLVMRDLKEIELDSVTTINQGLFDNTGDNNRNTVNLEVIRIPNLTTYNHYQYSNWWSDLLQYSRSGLRVQTNNLIDIEVGEMVTDLNIKSWNPVDVIADATKLAQLNANIRDHIAAKVSDRTGLSQLTFTVSTNLYNNLEQATKDAFTAKNWRVAGA